MPEISKTSSDATCPGSHLKNASRERRHEVQDCRVQAFKRDTLISHRKSIGRFGVALHPWVSIHVHHSLVRPGAYCGSTPAHRRTRMTPPISSATPITRVRSTG